jgi:glycosyltransferase 2 family protein
MTGSWRPLIAPGVNCDEERSGTLWVRAFAYSCYNPSVMERQARKKQIQFWLGIVISAACLAAIFLFIRPGDILAALRTARYEYLALSVVGVLAFMVLRAVRWRFMLDDRVTWSQVFHIQNIGYMLTMLLPFRIGDVARAVLIGKVPPVTMAQGVSTMVVERVLDLLFIVALLPLTLANVPQLPEEIQTAASISGVLGLTAIVILIAAANQRPFANRVAAFLLNRASFLDTAAWSRRADDLLAGLSSLTRLRSGLILVTLSILTWLPIIAAYYTGLLAVHIQPTWAMAGFVVCAAALSISAPSSPGQVGVFHAGVTFALIRILGQPEAESASFAFLYHGLNFVMMVILGTIGIYGAGATFGKVIEATQGLRPK